MHAIIGASGSNGKEQPIFEFGSGAGSGSGAYLICIVLYNMEFSFIISNVVLISICDTYCIRLYAGSGTAPPSIFAANPYNVPGMLRIRVHKFAHISSYCKLSIRTIARSLFLVLIFVFAEARPQPAPNAWSSRPGSALSAPAPGRNWIHDATPAVEVCDNDYEELDAGQEDTYAGMQATTVHLRIVVSAALIITTVRTYVETVREGSLPGKGSGRDNEDLKPSVEEAILCETGKRWKRIFGQHIQPITRFQVSDRTRADKLREVAAYFNQDIRVEQSIRAPFGFKSCID